MKRATIVTMGLVAAALVGCGGNNLAGPRAQKVGSLAAPKEVSQENSLVGVWQMQGKSAHPSLISFKNGGGVEVTEDTDYMATVTVSGAYVVDGNKLTLTPEIADVEPYILERFTTYIYSIEGRKLTLKQAGGEVTEWVKL